MRHRLLSKVAARARTSLGMQALEAHLDALDARLDAMESAGRAVYLGDDTALCETRWGGMLLVDTGESVLTPTLLLHGLWEPGVTGWMQRTLRPGQVFVDVGAHIGYYSVLGARLVGPTGRVVAVEAHPRMVQLLRRNLIVNGFGRVTTHHKAAWSTTETLKFHLRTHFGANSSTGSLGDRGLGELDDTEEVVEVQGAPVDDLLAGLPRVDLVKVDVEGAEFRVFSGMRRTLRENPNLTVMFEWSPGQQAMLGDGPEALVDLLEGHGLRFRLVEDAMAPIERSRLLELHYGNVVATR